MAINNTSEVVDLAERIAVQKAGLSTAHTLLLGLLAGAYISIGGALATYVSGGMTALTETNPSMGSLLSGVFFPIALILIVLVGGELFTGNTAFMAVGLQRKKVAVGTVLRNWGMVWCANFLGAVGFLYLMVYLPGVLDAEPWRSTVIAIGTNKVSMSFGIAFLKGIAANWLVCLAVWLGLSSQSMPGRMLGLWLPVMAFVALGFEHSIANMYYLPMAWLSGADFTIADMLIKNLLPVTLGNIVGGALLVGGVYTYLNPTHQPTK